MRPDSERIDTMSHYGFLATDSDRVLASNNTLSG